MPHANFEESFRHVIDDKHRIYLPKEHREAMKSLGNTVCIVTFNDRSLRIYPSPTWEEVEDKIRQLRTQDPPLYEWLIMQTRVFFARETIDPQGRIQLPLRLLEHTGILSPNSTSAPAEGDSGPAPPGDANRAEEDRAIRIIGAQSFIEIWSEREVMSELKRRRARLEGAETPEQLLVKYGI